MTSRGARTCCHPTSRLRGAILAVTLCLTGYPALVAWAETAPCDAPVHHQFDFWIGDWVVSDAEGDKAGTNRIASILDGCVLQENWAGGGMRGESYNIYDTRSGQWHQTWVDTTGRLLQLDGGLEGDRMVLSGEGKTADGKKVRHEISWEPLEDGRVRQRWRATVDRGKTWREIFDGYYARRD